MNNGRADLLMKDNLLLAFARHIGTLEDSQKENNDEHTKHNKHSRP